jgi:hypothetical protein
MFGSIIQHKCRCGQGPAYPAFIKKFDAGLYTSTKKCIRRSAQPYSFIRRCFYQRGSFFPRYTKWFFIVDMLAGIYGGKGKFKMKLRCG